MFLVKMHMLSLVCISALWNICSSLVVFGLQKTTPVLAVLIIGAALLLSNTILSSVLKIDHTRTCVAGTVFAPLYFELNL